MSKPFLLVERERNKERGGDQLAKLIFRFMTIFSLERIKIILNLYTENHLGKNLELNNFYSFIFLCDEGSFNILNEQLANILYKIFTQHLIRYLSI